MALRLKPYTQLISNGFMHIPISDLSWLTVSRSEKEVDKTGAKSWCCKRETSKYAGCWY